MRLKVTSFALHLGKVSLNVSVWENGLNWSITDFDSIDRWDSIALDKLLTPPDVDQLAYDLYKVIGNFQGPANVAAWEYLWLTDSITVPTQQYQEYSRIGVLLDMLIRSNR